MSDTEFRDSLVRLLNTRIDLFGKWINEGQEAEIFGYLVDLILPLIPSVIRPLLFDAEDGIDDEELLRHKTIAVESLMDRIRKEVPVYLWAMFGHKIGEIVETLAEQIFRFAQRGLAIGPVEGGE